MLLSSPVHLSAQEVIIESPTDSINYIPNNYEMNTMPNPNDLRQLFETLNMQLRNSDQLQQDFVNDTSKIVETLERQCQDLSDGLSSTKDTFNLYKVNAEEQLLQIKKSNRRINIIIGVSAGSVGMITGLLIGLFH